jgi:hypothetical protein
LRSYKTTHENINFRSRLEAKWASFFTALKWEWDYEPVDFEGWIPDFAIYGKHDVIYVEIKPVFKFPDDIAKEIEASGCEEEVLICGISPKVARPHHSVAGWLRDGTNRVWDMAPMSKWGYRYGFCHDSESYRDRITGIDTGFPNGDSLWESNVREEINTLWAKATNKVQWKP